jgi:hypothetical protein
MYKLIKENETITVYKNGKVASKGFMTEEDALHSVWCLEGKVFDHFYVTNVNGEVKCIDRGLSTN